MKAVIESTTLATTHKVIIPSDQYVTIAQSGLSGSEIITLEVELDGVYVALLPAVTLSTAVNVIQIGGPCTYRISKPTTANATSVYVEF